MDNYEIKEVIKLKQSDICYGDASKEGFIPLMVRIVWRNSSNDNYEYGFPYWIKKEENGQFKWTIEKKSLQGLLDWVGEFGGFEDDSFLWTLADKILSKLGLNSC